MKKFCKLSVFSVIICIVMLFSAVCVFAENIDETSGETIEQTTTLPQEPTQQPTETPTELTQPTEPTEESTQAESTEETQQNTEDTTVESTTEPSETIVIEEVEPTDSFTLPEIDENEFQIPTVVIDDVVPQSATLVAGIISWLCVAIGIIVIISILSSHKGKNYMNGGKQRYESGDAGIEKRSSERIHKS